MKLNELKSIIMDKYLNELNKTIIYKTIDKVAEKIAQDIYLSIYNEFIHNEHYINDKNNLAAEKKSIINKALNENLIKDKFIEKEVKNNENLVQNKSINKKVGSAPELPAINDLSEQVLSKENSSKENLSKNDLSKENNSEFCQCNNYSQRQIHKTFDNNLNKNSNKDSNKDFNKDSNKDSNKEFSDKNKNNFDTNESIKQSENNKLDKNEKEKLYDNIVDTLITILKDNDNKININKLLTDKEANNLLKAVFMLTNIDKDINKDMQLLNSKLFGEDIFNTFFNLK